jgi:hypothetical protein
MLAVIVTSRPPKSNVTRNTRSILLTAMMTPCWPPAKMTDDVPGAHAFEQAIAKLTQQLIAERVPQRVVNILEVIDIDEQNGDHPFLFQGLDHGRPSRFAEHRPIDQSGERVEMRQTY